jgi:hypothetical protein
MKSDRILFDDKLTEMVSLNCLKAKCNSMSLTLTLRHSELDNTVYFCYLCGFVTTNTS